MQLSGAQVSETVAKAKAGHYQLACAMAFEGTQDCSCDTGINHPNQVCSPSALGKMQRTINLVKGICWGGGGGGGGGGSVPGDSGWATKNPFQKQHISLKWKFMGIIIEI